MTTDLTSITPECLQAAAAYSAQHGGLALLVQHQGRIIFEEHTADHPPGQALPIASGTKSLAGILAVTAAADGLLSLDEPITQTLPEWQDDPRKSRITARHLLHLVSGLEAGGKAGRRTEFEAALKVASVAEPGERFFYGSIPFQVFGEYARRKLSSICPDPLDYLYGRVFDRIGLQVGRWRRGPDGWPDLSAGAVLAAREWAKLGEFIRQDGVWNGVEIIPRLQLAECFQGSRENAAYGLGWWLNRALPESSRAQLKQATLGLEDLASERAVPPDLVYAAGAGKQRLYVSRNRALVIVRQAGGVLEAIAAGERCPFSDAEFFRLLFP